MPSKAANVGSADWSLFTTRPVSVPVPNKVANIQFDPDGDVVLLLKNCKGTARFQVNSSILCMSSPVFRAMLGTKSHFKEAQELASRDPSTAPVGVNIEDDDPNVFLLFFESCTISMTQYQK